MNDLIKITNNEQGIQTINARELHEFLESGRKFSDWIKQRIESYDFIENEDFTVHKFVIGKATQIDYFISIDMAKELSMVENNERGKQARRYFIQMEKKAKTLSVPQNFSQALRLAATLQEENERLLEVQHIQDPKVKVYDDIISSNDLVSMGDVAKLIDIGMGRNKLFKELRQKHILMDSNIPYQQFIDRGYFKVKEGKFKTNNGKVRITKATWTTQKGIEYLLKEFKKQGQVL